MADDKEFAQRQADAERAKYGPYDARTADAERRVAEEQRKKDWEELREAQRQAARIDAEYAQSRTEQQEAEARRQRQRKQVQGDVKSGRQVDPVKEKRSGGFGALVGLLAIGAIAYAIWDSSRDTQHSVPPVTKHSAPQPAPVVAKEDSTEPSAPSVAKPTAPMVPDPAQSVRPGSGESFRDRTADGQPCPECPEMVVVPAGSFMMGAPANEHFIDSWVRPQHRVTIMRPFAVGRFELTFAEWDACVAEGGCHRPDDRGWGRGKHPVINVSWDDTQAYIRWLSRKTGKSYRLLTEAEWEYAARAGTTTPFWQGSSISTDQANYNGDRKGLFRERTVPVDSFAPNPWGLHNVHGNVFEWVEDCWHDSYSGAPRDGSAWVTYCNNQHSADGKVIRGGTWYFLMLNQRSAARYHSDSGRRSVMTGFRVGRPL